MQDITHIQTLSQQKLDAADALLQAGFADDALYLGGYALELTLKACICKTLGIESFFTFDSAELWSALGAPSKGTKDLFRPFKVHDFTQLIILSGFHQEFKRELSVNKDVDLSWFLVKEWSENDRYSMGLAMKDATVFIEKVKILVQWFRNQT